MSIDTYQNYVTRSQKDIADLRKKMATEIGKKSKLTKDMTTLIDGINRSKNLTTITSKSNQLSRKQQELGKIEKKIGDFEEKISKKTKDLNRYQKSLNQSIDRENKNRVTKEKQSQRELLNSLQQINRELQKKSILEKEIGVNVEDTIEPYYLLKGDIKGYSMIMDNPKLSTVFPEQFELIVKKNALDCFYFSVNGGDSITILEKNVKKIIKVAKRIIEDTSELETNPQIRIAIDYGDITYKHNDGIITKIITGSPLRIASRLEPFVIPAQVWCTENCFTNIEYNDKMLITHIDNLEHSGDSFNIKKTGSPEDDIFIKIYKV